MFKAFYWMFTKKDLCKTFFKHSSVILLAALLTAAIFCLSGHLIFINIHILYGHIGLLFALCCVFLSICFLLGYYWECTASIINRKTDIRSSRIYDGKIAVVESIELPKIKIFKFCWRGFASAIAMFIMELPVFLLAVSIVLFYKPDYMLIAYFLQILVCFLSLGLFWNYAKNNSIFSMLNLYVAGYLLENYPLRYIKNSILSILNYALYYVIVVIMVNIFRISPGIDLNNCNGCIRFLGFGVVVFAAQIYMLYVQAYLIGTLSPKDDY